MGLKRMGRYLNYTKDHGLVFNPNDKLLKLDAYHDADFAGMFGHKKPTSTACLKSHTGFIITFEYCKVLWVSKLHNETGLLSMELEIIELDHCLRELFPIIDITFSSDKSIGLPFSDTMTKVSIHEDNKGALVLE